MLSRFFGKTYSNLQSKKVLEQYIYIYLITIKKKAKEMNMTKK